MAAAVTRRPAEAYPQKIHEAVAAKGVTNLALMTLAGQGQASRVDARNAAGITEGQEAAGQNPKLIEMMMYAKSREELSKLLQGSSKDLLAPMIPFNVRQAILAQYNAKASDQDRLDDDYVRMKSFWSGLTVGFAFSVVARFIRVIVRVAFFWLSALVAMYNQSCYGSKMPPDKKYNIVAEDFRRIWYEVVDLVMCVGAALASFVNFFAPEAISLNGMRDYYMERIDQVRERDITFLNAKQAYEDDRAQARAVTQAART